MKRVLCLFGTRPEIIKLAPVLREFDRRTDRFEVLRVTSSQHMRLLHPFAKHFGVRIDRDLAVMSDAQTPEQVASRVLDALGPMLRALQSPSAWTPTFSNFANSRLPMTCHVGMSLGQSGQLMRWPTAVH